MTYCLNPNCPNPSNPEGTKFCITCGTKLLLRERYRAIKPIGQGGFGKTFLAIDEDKPSKPRCVIKQFYPQAQGTSTSQKAAELFQQEAVRLDELGKHPQIPELLAHFSQDNQQYLVQEFIDGQNLAQELAQNGAFNEAQIRQLMNDLLLVLEFVHGHQVIHRDIKPENIIRRNSDRQLVLVDFGAAKVASSAALNQTGTSIGSPEYVAPEQIRGKAIYASDIYSLGVTCIHLLTNKSPFDLYDINEDIWLWRKYLKSSITESLGKVFDKMIESVPNRRYQAVAEVIKDVNFQINSSAKMPPSIIPAASNTTNSPPSKAAINQSKSQVDLELEQLKSQTLGGIIPPTTNTPVKGANSKVDLELQELKSQILGGTTSKTETESQPSKSPSPSPPAKSNSQVDLELEELRSQFGASKKPNNPT